jgi:hypothetical protein
MGEPEIEGKVINVVVRFPVALRDQAREAAKTLDLSMSQLIRRAVRDEIERVTGGKG